MRPSRIPPNASLLAVLVTSGALLFLAARSADRNANGKNFDGAIRDNSSHMMEEGRQTFRYDTFGDEDFWGGMLRLHEPIAGAKHGGSGPGLTPEQALGLGLKVDVDALPKNIQEAVQAKKVNFDDPETTFLLLKNNALVGVKAFADPNGRVTSMGITCAFCHSTVDDAIMPGIGHRLDGWPNRDLNVGGIVATARNLKPMTDLLGVDEATLKQVLNGWGPGMFDAEVILDGKALRPDGKTGAVLIPPAFGLAGVNNHTWTGAWGTVTYWNAFVANLEMHGKGTMFDTRLDNAQQYPIAARARMGHKHDVPDLITPKLAALQFYQLAIPAPQPPAGSFNANAATRGKIVFEGKAACATCHLPPLFTEPGWNLHTAKEVGVDEFQADRSPDHRYRTAPLRGLFAHSKGGFYHDGRFKSLGEVVEHYNTTKGLQLSDQEKSDLIEYLKSL